MQYNKNLGLQQQSELRLFKIVFLLFVMMQGATVWAASPVITELNFSSLAGDKVQIQLGMSESAVLPKIFQTDNPARIALDFSGVKSGLDKKMYAINQGAVNTVYVVESGGRTRVVINLSKTVPYETKVEGNQVYVILKPIASMAGNDVGLVNEKNIDKKIVTLLPEQTIKHIDFRRGPKGEGRLLLQLSTANTVVDVKERGGKVVLNFLNTKLPEDLIKSFDVSDFATPVLKVDARPRGAGVNITVTPINGNYDYVSYQSDGLLTVDFIPLSAAEKAAKLKEKFPYSGKKLTLNFQDIEVRSVLQILADFTDLNIIAADSVGGNVTLRLNDVPWDQAFELILKSKGLARRQTGNVILVAPSSEIIKIEEEELAAQKVVERLEPLRTEYIQINYAKAKDFREILMAEGTANSGGGGSGDSSNSDSFRIISPRGTVIVDSRTNTLIVKDIARQLEEIRALIKLLDIPVRQVLIEARVVVASTGFARQLGVKFGIGQKDNAIGSNKGYGFTGSGIESSENSAILADLGTALAASGPGALAMTLARGADYVLNLEIEATQNHNSTELISNPRVMTTDRVTAKIKQGVQIPYQTRGKDGAPVTELVDAVLELEVTPQITPSGSVIMELNIKKDAPGAVISTNGELTISIDTREVNTTVQVEDGETIVLGGIYETSHSESDNSVPWLVDLPMVGWMFKNTNPTRDKKELLVFITPKIIKDSLSIR